jgi:hypothetical protein
MDSEYLDWSDKYDDIFGVVEYDKNNDKWDMDDDEDYDYYSFEKNNKSKRALKKEIVEMRKTTDNIDVFAATQDFLFCIEKELMEKTWHPLRYMNWCLDIEEQKEFGI